MPTMDNAILTAIALCHKPQHLPTATNNIRCRNPAQRQRAVGGAKRRLGRPKDAGGQACEEPRRGNLRG
jgi:hypothetical protein